MSVVFSAVHRRGVDFAMAELRLEAALTAIAPESVRAASRVDVLRLGRHLQGTLNLGAKSLRRDGSLCQGKLYDSEATWWQTGDAMPDGSYAIFREDESAFEALTDPAGSRMLWTYFDDALFAVSNSERALTIYVGRFDLDRAVVPWVVSTGTRGLGKSYNRHLRQVPPASLARLDKNRWTLDVSTREIRFEVAERSREEHLARMASALDDTFAAFGRDDAVNSELSLSGGWDSRAIAVYLGRDRAAGWRSHTSGSRKAAGLGGSDVSVAAKVADALGFSHRRFTFNRGSAPAEVLLRRFALGGEGRHDHLNRLDDDTVLRTLFGEGVVGIVRGDEGFGLKAAKQTPVAIRQNMELLLCQEIENLRPRLAAFGLQNQEFPPVLRRGSEETLAAWRDRLYHTFRIPTVLAALNEHKAGYVDVVNPLLSRRALDVARSLPDAMRSGKALFRDLVREIGPDVEYASQAGAPIRLDSLALPEVRRAMSEALTSETAERVFGRRLTDWVRSEIRPVRYFALRRLQQMRVRLRRLMPGAGQISYRVDPLRLAFRLYVATVVIGQLEADAAQFATDRAPFDRAA